MSSKWVVLILRIIKSCLYYLDSIVSQSLSGLRMRESLSGWIRWSGWGFLGSLEAASGCGGTTTTRFGYARPKTSCWSRGHGHRVCFSLVSLIGDGGGGSSPYVTCLCLHGGEHFRPSFLRHVTAHTGRPATAAGCPATRPATITTCASWGWNRIGHDVFIFLRSLYFALYLVTLSLVKLFG